MSFIILLNVISSCEYEFIKESYNSTNITFINSQEIPETVNSITSVFTIILGIIGLLNENTFLYLCNMVILILLGLSSSLHHYFYKNKIFWEADILSIEIQILFVLLFLFNYKNYSNFIIKVFILCFIFFNFLTMVILNTKNISIRTLLIQYNIGIIILKQLYSCFYIFKLKNDNFLKFFYLNLINGLYLSLAIMFWYLDHLCNHSFHQIINSHALWHIFISLALFNTINVNIIFKCIVKKNNNYKIYPLFKKLPYLTYIIKNNYKINTCNISTYTELHDIRFLDNLQSKKHKRVKSCG